MKILYISKCIVKINYSGIDQTVSESIPDDAPVVCPDRMSGLCPIPYKMDIILIEFLNCTGYMLIKFPEKPEESCLMMY
jgi:hypothetical protein